MDLWISSSHISYELSALLYHYTYINYELNWIKQFDSNAFNSRKKNQKCVQKIQIP